MGANNLPVDPTATEADKPLQDLAARDESDAQVIGGATVAPSLSELSNISKALQITSSEIISNLK